MFARYAAFTALNRIGTNAPSAWVAIVRGLESKSARVREGTVFALRETYDSSLLTELTKLLRNTTKPAAARRAALELIAALHHQQPWASEHSNVVNVTIGVIVVGQPIGQPHHS